MATSKKQALKLRIVLLEPNYDVVFGIQKGNGNSYETILKQQYKGSDLVFEFEIEVKSEQTEPDFAGPIVQGPKGGRYIYIDIGTYAGQANSEWGRRLKVPLTGITQETLVMALGDSKSILETRVPGKGKDGGPNCATVKPFSGWIIART